MTDLREQFEQAFATALRRAGGIPRLAQTPEGRSALIASCALEAVAITEALLSPENVKALIGEVERLREALEQLANYERGRSVSKFDLIVEIDVMRSIARQSLQGTGEANPNPGEAVAWRVKDLADGWILCSSLEQAVREADGAGNLIEPLYRKGGQP